MTNRKSHTRFRLVPKSTTFDDLELQLRTLFQNTFLAMRVSTMRSDLLRLEMCTHDVKSSFADNALLLNTDKSYVMMIGTASQLRLAETIDTVTVAVTNLTVSTKLKSLGVIFDPKLTFDRHVSSVCKACNYHIWALRHIRRALPLDVVKNLHPALLVQGLTIATQFSMALHYISFRFPVAVLGKNIWGAWPSSFGRQQRLSEIYYRTN